MSINIDKATMEALVAKLIFEELPQQKRDDLIKEAIAKILEPPPDYTGYGPRVTILQQSFESAVTQMTHTVVREEVQNNPEVKAAIQKATRSIVDKLAEDNSVHEAIAGAIVSVLQKKDY